MLSTRLRMGIVRALAGDPVPQLEEFGQVRDRDLEGLLLWLDESGLALYFLRRVEEHHALAFLPAVLQEGLISRQEQNRGRVAEMLREFARVNDLLRSAGVRYAFVKGFTLVPDFCPDADIRHHNDIDVVIHPDSFARTIEVVHASGYRLGYTQATGEHRFYLPLPRLSPGMHDIYRAPDVGILELHASMCESPDDIPLRLPEPFDCLETQELRDITFPTLSRPDKFLVQTLHTFRHLAGGWIRLSWLYEVARFLHTNREVELWNAFCDRAGSNQRLRNACGVTLSLASNVFRAPFPEPLRAWCVDELPSALRNWALSAGTRWALSSAPDNRSPILIQRHFLGSDLVWGRYLRRRLLPFEAVVQRVKPDPLRPASPQSHRGWSELTRLCVLHARRLVGLGRDTVAMARAARKTPAPLTCDR